MDWLEKFKAYLGHVTQKLLPNHPTLQEEISSEALKPQALKKRPDLLDSWVSSLLSRGFFLSMSASWVCLLTPSKYIFSTADFVWGDWGFSVATCFASVSFFSCFLIL